MQKIIPKHFGFTLIELMVVIVIIGILSGIGLASYTGTITKAKVAEAQTYLKDLRDSIRIAHISTDKYLGQITGNWCSDCACRSMNLKDIATTNSCYTIALSAITKIEQATDGVVTGVTNNIRDPWGGPYLIDENEWEWAATPCRKDVIRSAGPDSLLGTADDVVVTLGFSKKCP
ncbi:hypothetical protein CO180_03200 [candidate division WWE3 bacterium CG_4_9_14_3_um_filter_41_6]|uniref:Type II secretion system protein GspG C-terminal domain-containing protein n=1 Tax=candidate division WWE3 bacterium CG_4_10_14_0_2_um_filter_41_14 TaxID=1975072 RepID=A0A2M7TL41_UNCKA|nr:MAG: hypothetical protein COY32_01270 [candidate division WWE3 bacterium CG_4_10_14_0_2_um_filter_41_14]PJA38589.1 MAG: hypothetical protein CO180_03200 [candidate division WWE3 bacterium CG_4_9_14_3_um_filter_41_6]